MSNTLSLLPCPFCGCKAVASINKDESLWSHDVVDWTRVHCTNDECNAQTEATCEGYEPSAIEVWNRRTPQPAPAPLSEMPYEKRKAIQEGEQIGASDAWFKARHEMLDTVDRRNVFRAGFDRGWNAALAAQGGKCPMRIEP